MEQIKTVSLSRLRIDAHCVYMTHTYERITASTDAVKTILGSLPSKFEDKLKIEKSIMDTQKCSPVTKELQDADRRQDKALSALRILVRGQKYNQNIYNADAADHVYEMLMEYGNINSKRYESQVGDIESILRKLAGEYSSEVTTLLQYAPSISTEITELKTANAAFKAALEKRGDYNKNKPDKTFHQIKKEIEPIYHEIAAIINANALVNTDPGFEKIITRLNPEIDLLNKEFHHVRHNLSKAQPSKIPDQQYTGLPITPIPEVFLKTTDKGTIRLELGKDFNIRFKDNVEIGNATLTIHGKSSYKGKKTVTFTIERTLS